MRLTVRNAFGRIAAVALVIALGMVGQVSAGPITYELVNYPQYQNGSTLSGFITTDGAIGSLAASDIIAWSVTVSNGGSSQNISNISDNASVDITENLVATPSEIYLPIPPPGQMYGNAFYIHGVGDTIFWNNYGGGWQYFTNLGDGWNPFPPGGSPFVIAGASVPEPSSLTLLGLAVVCVTGYAGRRAWRRAA